ncbi:MAG: hypothetical protein EXR69_07285 [Myxococcales bacterium]|nr:hypothetical protein [Myxococcales bacterium]
MNNVDISGNDALYRGGGLYIYSDYDVAFTEVSITANEVTGESSSAQGAGAYLDVLSLTLTDSDVSANEFGPSSTTGCGGGVYSIGGTLTLAGTALSTNAAYIGGGWYGSTSAIVLDEDSQLSANSASYHGGWAYLSSSDFTCAGSTLTSGGLSSNTAPSGGAGVYIFDTSSTLTATVWDTGAGPVENLADTVPNDASIASTNYIYGNDEPFTCTNRTCL